MRALVHSTAPPVPTRARQGTGNEVPRACVLAGTVPAHPAQSVVVRRVHAYGTRRGRRAPAPPSVRATADRPVWESHELMSRGPAVGWRG